MDKIKQYTPKPSTVVGTLVIAGFAAAGIVWASNNVAFVKKHIG